LAKGVRADIASGRIGPLQPVIPETTPDGFQVICPDSGTRFLWSGVQGVGQDENAIYFYITPMTGHVIPRRAFANGAQAQELYETAHRGVDAGKTQSLAPSQ